MDGLREVGTHDLAIKHYRASDVANALRLSKEIFALVGDALIEQERSDTVQLNRAWPLLVAYGGGRLPSDRRIRSPLASPTAKRPTHSVAVGRLTHNTGGAGVVNACLG